MKTGQICIGLESTAHTFGVSIVDADGNIFSDVKFRLKCFTNFGIVVGVFGGTAPKEFYIITAKMGNLSGPG